MSKPQQEPQRELYFRDVNFLYELFERLDNLEDFKKFLKDLLTPAELRMIKKRWHIACLLDEGRDVRQVARQAQVSTGTVMKVKNILRHGQGGLVKALEATRPDRRREPKYEPPSRTTPQRPRPTGPTPVVAGGPQPEPASRFVFG